MICLKKLLSNLQFFKIKEAGNGFHLMCYCETQIN